MPKDKSPNPLEKGRIHPYKPYPSHGKGHEGEPSDTCGRRKDWEDATCPICMDFPHNAVLLLCTSHEKGCRPYMCNTSYRHSNCLNQYQKAHLEVQKVLGSSEALGSSSGEAISLTGEALSVTFVTIPADTEVSVSSRSINSLVDNGDALSSRSITRRVGRNHAIPAMNGAEGFVREHVAGHEPSPLDEDECMEEPATMEPSNDGKGGVKGLKCPHCRGRVNGWRVVDAAREHLNHKTRSCSQELCSFTGAYEELRVHARSEHPLARPSKVDAERLRDWRRLEHQRNLGDVLSTIRAAMPGATVVGDHVLEEGSENDNDDFDFPSVPAFLFLHVFGPAISMAGGRAILPGLWGLRGHRGGGTARPRQSGESVPGGGNVDAGNSPVNGGAEEHTAGLSGHQHRSEP